MTKTPLTRWQNRLTQSLHLSRNSPETRFVQMATVNQQSQPENRTLVNRGFDSKSGALCFITDTRSDKYSTIQYNPAVQLCWYFVKSREQYRLSGKAELIEGEDESLKARWGALSESSKKQFCWGAPNYPLDNSDLFTENFPIPDLPPKHFCLIQVAVTYVDYLNLSAENEVRGQLREQYTLGQNGWSCQPVVP